MSLPLARRSARHAQPVEQRRVAIADALRAAARPLRSSARHAVIRSNGTPVGPASPVIPDPTPAPDTETTFAVAITEVAAPAVERVAAATTTAPVSDLEVRRIEALEARIAQLEQEQHDQLAEVSRRHDGTVERIGQTDQLLAAADARLEDMRGQLISVGVQLAATLARLEEVELRSPDNTELRSPDGTEPARSRTVSEDAEPDVERTPVPPLEAPKRLMSDAASRALFG